MNIMKRLGMWMLALVLALTPMAALGAEPEAETELIEEADYRAEVARDALPLLQMIAAIQSDGSGFNGAPDANTAWRAMSMHARRFAEDGQVFTDAEMGGLYADLFAFGTFDAIAADPEELFVLGDGGYRFQMADGDPEYTVVINATDTYSDTAVYADVSAYFDMDGQYPETFSANATAVLVPSPLTEFGAQVGGWIPSERPVFATAEATSVLAPQEGNTYLPGNAIDGRLDTCWAYAAKDGAPQSILLRTAEPQVVRGLVLTPGYAKSAYAFESNRRVAALTVTLSDETSFRFTLNDVAREAFDGTYVLPFHGVHEADWVKVEITETHKGARFDDACISEIEFF